MNNVNRTGIINNKSYHPSCHLEISFPTAMNNNFLLQDSQSKQLQEEKFSPANEVFSAKSLWTFFPAHESHIPVNKFAILRPQKSISDYSEQLHNTPLKVLSTPSKSSLTPSESAFVMPCHLPSMVHLQLSCCPVDVKTANCFQEEQHEINSKRTENWNHLSPVWGVIELCHVSRCVKRQGR